jgi:hypothetical protein
MADHQQIDDKRILLVELARCPDLIDAGPQMFRAIRALMPSIITSPGLFFVPV